MLLLIVGAGAIRFGGRIAATFRRTNERLYRRLPDKAGLLLVPMSPSLHRLMGYMIISWGALCASAGVVVLLYSLATA